MLKKNGTGGSQEPPIVGGGWELAHIVTWFKIYVHNRWSEYHLWHVCFLCPCRVIFKVCKWGVYECVCIFCLLAIPMYGQETVLAIILSPAYLITCLEVLVQKIESILQECILLFFLFQICTLHTANCKDYVPRVTWTVMSCAFNCETLSFLWLYAWRQSDMWRSCLRINAAVTTVYCTYWCVCVLQNSPHGCWFVSSTSFSSIVASLVVCLIKLTAVSPKSNQKVSTSLPDSVSCCCVKQGKQNKNWAVWIMGGGGTHNHVYLSF